MAAWTVFIKDNEKHFWEITALKVGQHNEELRKVTEKMEAIKYATSQTDVDDLDLDLIRLLPKGILWYTVLSRGVRSL